VCDLLQCIQGLVRAKYLEAGYNLFSQTQVYFNHPVLTVLTIREQINYSAFTTGGGMFYWPTAERSSGVRDGATGADIFPSITKGKYLLFISTCLVWA